jgi:hypothetical protein
MIDFTQRRHLLHTRYLIRFQNRYMRPDEVRSHNESLDAIESELKQNGYNLRYIRESFEVDVYVVFESDEQEALFKLTYL